MRNNITNRPMNYPINRPINGRAHAGRHHQSATRGSALMVIAGVLGFISLPAALLALLLSVGQPGLRFQYQWNGSAAMPIYYSCDYITATGLQRRSGDCPVVNFFPVELWS